MVTLFTQSGSVEVKDTWVGSQIVRNAERWNAKGGCKKCGAKTSALGVRHQVRTAKEWTYALVTADGRLFKVENGLCYLPCRSGCGRVRVATMVQGTFKAGKECNAKCMAACGPSCECKCEGRNHGAAFSL